jgi:hypothetical protein
MTTTTQTSTTENTLKQTWEVRLDIWSKSGLSKSAYCKRDGINYHQMIYWSRKLSSRSNTKPMTGVRKPESSSGFAAVAPPQQNPLKGVSIRLPNGIEIFGIEEQRIGPIVNQIINQATER